MSDKNSVNHERLKLLFDESIKNNVSLSSIAKELGCDASLVNRHYNGSKNVTLDFLVKYAKYFKVSADYLLGIDDNENEDIVYKISAYTHLSAKAVKSLHNDFVILFGGLYSNNFIQHHDFVDYILTSSNFIYGASSYAKLISDLSKQYQDFLNNVDFEKRLTNEEANTFKDEKLRIEELIKERRFQYFDVIESFKDSLNAFTKNKDNKIEKMEDTILRLHFNFVFSEPDENQEEINHA